MNLMNNRVKFFEEVDSGPEAHGKEYKEVYDCACDDYDPTTKDHTVLSSQAGQSSQTITVRNVYQEFRPEHNHIFELQSGYFKGVKFEIKKVAPYDDNPHFLKIVGET